MKLFSQAALHCRLMAGKGTLAETSVGTTDPPGLSHAHAICFLGEQLIHHRVPKNLTKGGAGTQWDAQTQPSLLDCIQTSDWGCGWHADTWQHPSCCQRMFALRTQLTAECQVQPQEVSNNVRDGSFPQEWMSLLFVCLILYHAVKREP